MVALCSFGKLSAKGNADWLVGGSLTAGKAWNGLGARTMYSYVFI